MAVPSNLRCHCTPFAHWCCIFPPLTYGAAGILFISALRKSLFRSVKPSRVTVRRTVTLNGSNPILPIRKPPFRVVFLLAEQQGFEPWRHFHALRDFESRLFDQLEYCSLFTTGSLYQRKKEKSSYFPVLFCKFHYIRHPLHDPVIVFRFVGFQTPGAVLDSIFQKCTIPAAVLPQRIQGTIAEQAVKLRFSNSLMAGKILAASVLHKFIVFHILKPPSRVPFPADYGKTPFSPRLPDG